ncbi:MAG: sulfite exporter TauE/SafE family protein [Deltaproteobacteria bacterium]|nr:sulfite exporter TauE/SafE family protein [Deltaproteobacteria bacterium]
MLTTFAIYCLFGALVGLWAGLMGAGGAVLLVPILHFTLARQGVDPSLVHHMAIATTMANILFTSSVAAYTHHRRGAVPWKTVAWMIPGILAGSFAGSYCTAYIPARPLTLGFAFFLLYAGAQTFVSVKPKASRHMPGKGGQFLLGAFIGAFSGLLGVGGAAVTIPILLVCGVPLLSVVAASGAFGFPIAVAGCTGYMLTAWNHPGLPPYSLGFVYLPALLGLVPASMVFTSIGVRLAHTLPQNVLRTAMGIFLLCMAIRMIWKLY